MMKKWLMVSLSIIILVVMFAVTSNKRGVSSSLRPAWAITLEVEAKNYAVVIDHFAKLRLPEGLEVSKFPSVYPVSLTVSPEKRKELCNFILKECKKIGKVQSHNLTDCLHRVPKGEPMAVFIEFKIMDESP